MNPQEVQALLVQLVDGISQIMQSGEVLSDEFQGLLANTLEALVQRLGEPTGEEIPPSQPPIEPSMPSSNVEGFAYDDRSRRLYVRFLGKHPERNGPIYQYENVPFNIFDIFRKGAVPAKTDGKNKWGRWWKGKYPSMGAAMYHLIRAGGYPYQRVS
jgi:hypothetical protein